MKTAVLVNRYGEYYSQTCRGVAPRYDGDDEGYVLVATVTADAKWARVYDSEYEAARALKCMLQRGVAGAFGLRVVS